MPEDNVAERAVCYYRETKIVDNSQTTWHRHPRAEMETFNSVLKRKPNCLPFWSVDERDLRVISFSGVKGDKKEGREDVLYTV